MEATLETIEQRLIHLAESLESAILKIECLGHIIQEQSKRIIELEQRVQEKGDMGQIPRQNSGGSE